MVLLNETGTVFIAWWWVIPLICVLLCIFMCRFSGRSRMDGWCCMMRHRRDDLEELRKEVRELKERIGPAK